jgi:pimeloyl-ACP methyl ester carboxylesterase
MSETINHDRRRILGATLMTIAAAQVRRAAAADSRGAGTQSSFGPLKQINAGVLSVGYAEAGPAGGPPVILLHGWPYDIHSYVDVAPLLASAGYRVIVPYLRGYGTTRFLSSETFRNGQHCVSWFRMTCIGKVSKGKVVLPDGTAVRVDTIEVESASRPALNSKFSQFIGMADDLPSDLAENLDHYLHGHPKK